MSAKARSLLKRLRIKKHEEDEKLEKERPKSEERRTENIKTLNLGAMKDETNGKITFIDPLDYFKTEHPIENDKTLEEFGLNEVDEPKKEEKKETEPVKKPAMKGLIGAVGFKIKFDEMMKARAKVKKMIKLRQKNH